VSPTNLKQTHATYITPYVDFQDPQGNTVHFGESRVTVEPIETPLKLGLRAADALGKFFVVAAALYLLAEIFRAFADGAFSVVAR